MRCSDTNFSSSATNVNYPLSNASGIVVALFQTADTLEPIHIHVCDGKSMEPGAPKWWVGMGKCMRADKTDERKYGIKNSDLHRIEEIICANSSLIFEMWADFFQGYEIEIHDSLK